MKSNNMTELRIDKYLWSVRIYKTRSKAADACRKGRVEVNEHPAKPSLTVKINDLIKVRKLPATFTYKVKDLPSARVSAKLAVEYIMDMTPDNEKEKLTGRILPNFGVRTRGSGRPTKKERRNIDRIRDDLT